jgi:hypothetical protein
LFKKTAELYADFVEKAAKELFQGGLSPGIILGCRWPLRGNRGRKLQKGSMLHKNKLKTSVSSKSFNFLHFFVNIFLNLFLDLEISIKFCFLQLLQ